MGIKSGSSPCWVSASSSFIKNIKTISREEIQDADRDRLLGANRSNSIAIARFCNNADRPIPRLHTRVEIVNTL